MPDKHRFSTCAHCLGALYFEDKRKRIESGKWVHEPCFVQGNCKPYPIPHQAQNGKAHKGQAISLPYNNNYNGNGNGHHATPSIVTIEPERPKANGILETMLEDLLAKSQTAPAINEEAILKIVRTEIAKYALPLTVEIKRPSGQTHTITGAHKQFPKLMALIADREHVYLYGAPGSGKSTAARQCSEALGLPYAYSSLNPQTPESRLVGFIHAGGHYVETDFYRLYKNGGVFCLDEMDNASPALLNTLNSLLENGHGSFPNGMVSRHPDFVLVSTGNTNGKGANIQFPDRRAFDSAFAERFAFMQWEYDTEQERNITLAINQSALNWYFWVQVVREYVKRNDIRLIVSPRASFKGAKLLSGDTFTKDEIAEMVVFKGLDTDTRDTLIRNCPMGDIPGGKS